MSLVIMWIFMKPKNFFIQNACFSTADIKVPLQSLMLFKLHKMKTECEKFSVLMDVGLWKLIRNLKKRFAALKQR